MSDLSRLRARLGRIEKTGRRIKAEIEELRAARLDGTEQLTRTEERRLLRLEQDYHQARADWAQVQSKIGAEERRLVADPAAFLRFT